MSWSPPVRKKDIPSSFYAGASYLRGLNADYENKNALGAKAGFRRVIRKGFDLRVGVIAAMAKGQDIKIDPTHVIGYTFKF